MTSFTIDEVEYRTYDHLYAVSRCGKVLRSYLPYVPVQRPDGYVSVGRRRLLHRMVAKCWVAGFEPRKHVHHINGIKSDNRAENLECLTAKEHFGDRHAGLHGRYARTPETREKIRQARLGTVTPDETKAKQRAALLGRKRPYFKRAPHTEESREQRSLNHVRNTACSIDGVEYRSFAEAAKATGVHRFTVRKRCLSENFPNYKLIP